jgi:hypothetical protein
MQRRVNGVRRAERVLVAVLVCATHIHGQACGKEEGILGGTQKNVRGFCCVTRGPMT